MLWVRLGGADGEAGGREAEASGLALKKVITSEWCCGGPGTEGGDAEGESEGGMALASEGGEGMTSILRLVLAAATELTPGAAFSLLLWCCCIRLLCARNLSNIPKP